jgi:hypothetical protein
MKNKLLSYIKTDPWSVFYEFMGFTFSIVGSFMVASKIESGWILYFVANTAFIMFSLRKKLWFILLLNMWFMVTNVIGIYNYLLH